LKVDTLDDGNLRLRDSVTADREEAFPFADAVADGLAELIESTPATHQARNLRVSYERDRGERRWNSRRVFLTLIAELRREA
jgi:hypothetical protein